MKQCSKCKVWKDERWFHNHCGEKDGLRRECKDCHCADVREYKRKHRQPNRYESTHQIISGQKQKLCTKCKKWKLETEFTRTSGNKTNQDKLNPECKICHKITRAKYVQKYNKNPNYKLNNTIRRTIWNMLQGRKNRKCWEKLVGYTVQELKKHLESQFQEGMTWDNYGEWHIDHIIPVSAFNFDHPEQIDFKRCWALKNLQPLWAKENICKYSKIKEHFQPMLKLKIS